MKDYQMKHNKQYTKDDILALLSRIEDEVIGEDIIPNPPVKDPDSWRAGLFDGKNNLKQQQRQSLNKIIEEVKGEQAE